MARHFLRLRRFFVHRVLHADDTPHRIALGAAIGIWIALLPLVGFQMVLTVALASLVRANRVVGVPLAWITNPFTIVPIYGGCLMLGRWLVGKPSGAVSQEALHVLDVPAETAHFLEWEFWTHRLQQLLNLSVDLWIGCLVVATASAIPIYLLTLWGVRVYRERRRLRVRARHLYRSQLRATRVGAHGEPA